MPVEICPVTAVQLFVGDSGRVLRFLIDNLGTAQTAGELEANVRRFGSGTIDFTTGLSILIPVGVGNVFDLALPSPIPTNWALSGQATAGQEYDVDVVLRDGVGGELDSGICSRAFRIDDIVAADITELRVI